MENIDIQGLIAELKQKIVQLPTGSISKNTISRNTLLLPPPKH